MPIAMTEREVEEGTEVLQPRRPGRPAGTGVPRVSLSFRLRPVPYRLMVEAADEAGLSLNEWVERMIVEVTRKPQPDRPAR